MVDETGPNGVDPESTKLEKKLDVTELEEWLSDASFGNPKALALSDKIEDFKIDVDRTYAFEDISALSTEEVANIETEFLLRKFILEEATRNREDTVPGYYAAQGNLSIIVGKIAGSLNHVADSDFPEHMYEVLNPYREKIISNSSLNQPLVKQEPAEE